MTTTTHWGPGAAEMHDVVVPLHLGEKLEIQTDEAVAMLEAYPATTVLPTEAHSSALAETRLVRGDQTLRWGGVR